MFVVSRVIPGLVTTYKVTEMDNSLVQGTFQEQELQKLQVPDDALYPIEAIIILYYTNHAEWIVSESPYLGFPTGVNDLEKTEFTVPGEGGLPDIQKLDTKYLQSSVFCNLRFTHF